MIDRVRDGEEAGRARAEHQRRHGDERVRGVEVTAEQEPGDPGAEAPAAQAPLVQVHEVVGPPPPRRREAQDGDQQEQDDDDGQLDDVDPSTAQRSRSGVGVARDGVPGGLLVRRAAPGHPVDESTVVATPRADERQLEPVEERPAEQRRLHLVVQRHEQRHHDRDEQQPVPWAAVAAVRRDVPVPRRRWRDLRWTSVPPLPGGAPGLSRPIGPAGTPVLTPTCHVHGSVRPPRDGHLHPPGQVAVQHVRRDRQPGPLGGEVCHVAQRGATRLQRLGDRVVLEVAGQEDVGARGRRGAGQRPAAAAAHGDPAAPTRSGSPAARTPPAVPAARRPPARELAQGHRPVQLPHPAEPGPRIAVRRLQRDGVAQPEDGGQRVVDPGVGRPVGVGVRDEQRRAGRGSAGAPAGPSGRRRARRGPGSAAAGGG